MVTLEDLTGMCVVIPIAAEICLETSARTFCLFELPISDAERTYAENPEQKGSQAEFLPDFSLLMRRSASFLGRSEFSGVKSHSLLIL